MVGPTSRLVTGSPPRLAIFYRAQLTCAEPPELKLGERASEVRLTASGEETVWFARHGVTPITELPAHWSDDYRALVQRRIEVIASNRNIGLIERPECKRRWATGAWKAM